MWRANEGEEDRRSAVACFFIKTQSLVFVSACVGGAHKRTTHKLSRMLSTAARHGARRALSSAASSSSSSAAADLAAALSAAPDAAAVAAALPRAARTRLLAALAREAAKDAPGDAAPPSTNAPPRSWAFPGPMHSPEYVSALLAAADTASPLGSLDASELGSALKLHDAARKNTPPTAPLTRATLARLALAVGIPFIGFGFVDNFVMILAGEEIEAVFGVRFGLSTMAAAGLGNLVSDVAGLGLADRVEAAAVKMRWGAPVVLAPADAASGRARVARVAGSVVGVAVGCVLGMVPLLWV